MWPANQGCTEEDEASKVEDYMPDNRAKPVSLAPRRCGTFAHWLLSLSDILLSAALRRGGIGLLTANHGRRDCRTLERLGFPRSSRVLETKFKPFRSRRRLRSIKLDGPTLPGFSSALDAPLDVKSFMPEESPEDPDSILPDTPKIRESSADSPLACNGYRVGSDCVRGSGLEEKHSVMCDAIRRVESVVTA